jgi:hypothetical protein
MSQSTDEECILCMPGYYRKNDNVTGEKCLQRVDINANCAKYHLLSEACETCIDDTYVKHYDEKYCSPPIPECKIYETSGIELSCKQCNFGFYFDTTTAQCTENDIFDPYCAYYNEKKECQECYFGFFYDTNRATPTCQPNTPEYVDKARCQEFHPLNKNECIGCASSATTIKLQYTCKGFPVDVTSRTEAYEYMAFCETYEMTLTGAFKCSQPKAEVQDDVESNKRVYALITDEEKAYDVTQDRIQYCDLHENTYKTVNDPLKCSKCYAIRKITTTFFYDNAKNTANCGETETDSGYCVKYFSSINLCRTYIFTNIDSTACPNYNRVQNIYPNQSDSSIKNKACPWYGQSTYTVNNCNVSGNEKDYQCYSRDDSNNCNVYHFFRDGMGVQFNEDLDFEIVISQDQFKCLQYNTFELENNNNCIQVSDDGEQCLMCAKRFYSIPTRTFTYELDSVESYISKINVSGFVDGCIKYNAVTELCERCAPGKFISRNECITCDGNNLAIDSTGLRCLQFVDTNFPNTCKQISVLGTTTYCIDCRDGFVGAINWNTAIVLSKSFYPIILNSQTMIEIESQASSFTTCIDSNDLFYYQESYKNTLDNCLFFQIYNDVTYCLGCKFGFTGEIYETPNSFLTVQNCVVDSSCDLSETYPLNDPFISSLVTCHKCNNDSLIPSFTFFYTTAVDTSSIDFIYKHSSNRTMNCSAPVISNCMIQFTTTDETVRNNWGFNSGTEVSRCVYCKPGYQPTYVNTLNDYFPYRYITSCTSISHCSSSLKPNQCEQCQTSGANADQNEHMLSISGETTSCQQNDYVKEDPFCSKTTALSPSGVCDECKDGYVYLNLKCIQLNITSCKYFRSSTCVESTKELDEMKSLIWREYNSDYVIKTINCVEIETEIANCEYYASETTCHQCATDYFVGNNGATCYQRDIAECQEYNDANMNCKKCNKGFDLTSSGACTLAVGGTARGCDQYSDKFCTNCIEDGFLPIKIKTNQTSICLNSTISKLCSAVDEDLLLNEKILSCLQCKSLSDFETVDTADDFQLSNYDFYDTQSATYADDNGLLRISQLWNYYSGVRSYFTGSSVLNTNLRFARFKYDYNVCQEYTSIDNCLKYDDSSFEMTFNCIECTADYYLDNNACVLRTQEAFCIEYEISSNTCRRFIDTWEYSIKLSTFDDYVIANAPPAKTESTINEEGIEGCISYYDQYTCRNCNRTTYLYDNLCLTVETIVPQCEIYSRDGLCEKCENELLLFQNKCLPKYSKNCDGFLSNTSCKRCPTTAPYLSGGSCIKNPEVNFCDIYSKVDSCFYCEDAYSRTQSGTCELKTNYINNCKKHLVGPFCSECEENYVLINNKCILNPNYDRNCLEFKATSECNICRFNYYFKEDQCYPCKTDSFECLFCNPDNPSQCLLCKSGFFMNNNFECVSIPDYTQPLIRLYQESLVSSNYYIIQNMVIALLSILYFK